jgi:hypothetical protein
METAEQSHLDKKWRSKYKFFHHFASSRRNSKHIWEVLDENGQVHFGQEALKKEATRHYNFFLRKWNTLVLLIKSTQPDFILV